MTKSKIFIACDTTNTKKLNDIINFSQTDKLKIGYKIGLEFFLSPNGRIFLSRLKKKQIFLDLKLNDIPNTCAGHTFTKRFKKHIVLYSAYKWRTGYA